MKPLAVLGIGCMVCAPLLGAAAAPPDSQTLREQSAAAYGPVPDAYRQVIELRGTAGAAKRVIYRRGADRREIDDDGPLHTEFGIAGGKRWHENANGHVVIDQADPGLATEEARTTTVTRVSTPIDAYVISTLNAKGLGTREFFDPATHYVLRREVVTATGSITTVYDDFRAFGARRLAGHWHTHDEPNGTDTDYFVREYVAGDVADGDVAEPAIKRALVEYPAGENRATLPAVFEPNGHIVVRLTINGRGLDFLLDTGSSSITFDPGVASQLGLTTIAKRKSSANAGRFDTGEAVVPLIAIGSLQMHDTVVSIVPLAFEEPNAKIVGLLGFDFLCESGITIDYDHQTVTAERFGSYEAPAIPRTIVLATRLGSQTPMTTVSVNGAIAERMIIDTGAAGPFMLFDYFARRHPEALPRIDLSLSTLSFTGAGGEFRARQAQLDSVRIGNVTFARFIGYIVASRASYSGDADGIIGPDFLRYFDVHLDYPNGMIYLVPNATGAKSMR